jgi:Ca2+-binding RTX toxin-like protein
MGLPGQLSVKNNSFGLQIVGNDLIISYEDISAAPGQISQITIQNHFASERYAIEMVRFGEGAGSTVYHLANLRGDNYTYSVHNGSDIGGEDIVLGTSGDDHIYGGIGSDILLGGGGSDVFIFQDEDDNRGGSDIILDFDLLNDTLDFTEIKTLSRAGVSIADNGYGNAVISTAYGTIELSGIAAADVSNAIFDFF